MSNDPDLLRHLVFECGYCDGTGFWTETVEGSDGRDAEVDYTCPCCDGTGEEQ